MLFEYLSSTPDEPPYLAVHFNLSYLPMLLSVLQDLERASIYEGTPSEILAMVINAEGLQDLFMAGIPYTISGCPIGMLAPFPRLQPTSSGWLPCDDFSWHTNTDYPLLWQYLVDAVADGYDYVVSGDNFLCPELNINHKTIIGASGTGVYESGKSGGEVSHPLTLAELPAHDHDLWYSDSPNVMATGVGTGDVGRIRPTGGYSSNHPTSEAGSGTAHNNMPPFIAMYWHISAK